MMTKLLFILLLAKQIHGDFPTIIEHGTNIHFTTPEPGVPEEISKSFSVIRMDFSWQETEGEKGIYNWSSYDILTNALLNTMVRPYYILDYGNPLYDGGNAPTSQTAINAFANWTVASLAHFKNKGIIWELWNEPNIGFWKPSPNATQYGNLALAVGDAIRSNLSVSSELFVGPATSGIDFNFMTVIFKMGVLKYFDAISSHPYRCGCPESVTSEYLQLRSLIDEYNPDKNKYIPMISSEWGWPTCVNTSDNKAMQCYNWNCEQIVTFERQAQWLTRQWLINNMNNITISIFYDFKDDGSDIEQREQNFGTVGYQYYNNSMAYIPKLSYNAAMGYHNMIEKNKYMAFSQYLSNKTITCGNCDISQVRVLKFGSTSSDMENLIVWYSEDCKIITDYNAAVNITVNVNMNKNGCWNVYDMYGNQNGQLCTDNNGQTVQISRVDQSPTYFLNFQ